MEVASDAQEVVLVGPLEVSPLPCPAPVSAHMEKLACHLHQQRVRQLKRMQRLQAAAVARAAQQREWEERQRWERRRQQEVEQVRKQQVASNKRRAAVAEERRKAKLAAAQAHAEEVMSQAAAKVQRGAARAASVAAERQEVAVLARVKHAAGAARKVEAVLQRATLEEVQKAQSMQQRMKRHQQAVQKAAEEKRAAEAARRAAEERREEARQLALARAEQEQAERAAFYLQRQQHKEAELQQRKDELAALQALKQRESCLRAVYARHRMELVAQREEERRAQLMGKLVAKQQRVATMEEERAAMLRAMEDMRRDIQQQEGRLKEALRLMEQGECVPAQKLRNLQRQLADLVIQEPAAGPPSRVSNHSSVTQGSRSTPGAGSATAGLAGCVARRRDGSLDVAMPAPNVATSTCISACSSGAADSIGSPRIPAIHLPTAHVAAETGQDEATCTVGEAEGQEMQLQTGPSTQQNVAREKLQQILEAEMARETERTVLLRGFTDDANRQRLLHMFALERQNAMELMQRLQGQLL